MPFFRVRTAFCGPPVIPHCKDIRFRVIAGYPDYGSSYHFYGIVRRRPQKGCFLRLYLAAVPSPAVRFCRPFPVRLVRLLLFLPSVPASAVRSRFRVFVPTIRFRFCRPVSLSPSGPVPAVFSRLCRPLLRPFAGRRKSLRPCYGRRLSGAGASPLRGSAIRLRARIRRCRKFCSDWD